MTTTIQNLLRIGTRLWPVAALSLALFAGQHARADVLAGWDVNGVDLDDANHGIDAPGAPYSFTAGTLLANVADAKLTLGSVNRSTTAGQYGFKISSADAKTSLADAITANHYIQFTIEAAPGYVLNLSGIYINGQSSATGADNGAILNSVDGFSSGNEIASVSGKKGIEGGFDTDGSGFGAIDLSAPRFQGISSITFRVYGWNTSSSSGAGITYIRNMTSQNDLVINGTLGLAGPAAPATFTATAASDQQIDLSWTKNGAGNDVIVAWNSIDTFGVPVDGTAYTAGNFITGGGTVLYVGSATNANHSGLDANVTNYYKAWSVNGNEYSSGLTANATTQNLPAPTANPASATNINTFTASWDTVIGATGYRLDVSPRSEFLPTGTTLLTNDFEGLDWPPLGWIQYSADQSSAQKRSGTYSAQLNSTNDYLITPLLDRPVTLRFWSHRTSTTPTVIVEQSASTDGPWVALTGSPFEGTSGQFVGWETEVGNSASVYLRFRKTGSTGNVYVDDVHIVSALADFVPGYDNRMVTDGSTTSASVTGLVSKTEYFYRVRATNDTSTSGNSAIQSVTTLVMPAPLSQAGSNPGGDRFDANWDAVSGAAGYRLDVSTNIAFSDFQAGYQSNDVGNVTTHTVTGLQAQVTYYYRVRAYDAGSTSVNSTTQTVTTVLKAEPSNHASDFRATVTTHRTIVLEWTDAAGGELPDGYIVRGSTNGFEDIPAPADGGGVVNVSTWTLRYANNVGYGVQRDEVSGQFSYGLLPGRTYYFKLFPVANSGTDSNYKTNGFVPEIAVTTLTDVPFEDFESGVGYDGKTEYATDNVTLKSGTWELNDVLLISDTGDKKYDQRALRIRNRGVATMLFNVTDVETMTLEHANYTGDTGGKFIVERSIDGGASWHQIGTEVTCGANLQTASFPVHRLAASRLRICKTAEADNQKRINIDNIRFTPFEHEGSVFRFR